MSKICQSRDTTIDFLRAKKLLYSSFVCKFCYKNCTEISHHCKDGKIWRCPKCRRKFSIRKDSFFSQSNLRIEVLILLLYLWSVESSHKQTKQFLPKTTSEHSIVDWYSFIRDICKKTNDLLRQFDGTVEVDETYFGALRKNERGNKGIDNYNTVFGIFERISKYIKLWHVQDTKKNTLLNLIKNNVEVGSTINSDGAAQYKCLPTHGYNHNVVIHEREFVSDDGTHTNNIENVWGHLKTGNRSRRGVKNQMKQQYLDEFVWRWNNRQKGFNDWDSILSEIQRDYPL